jgi:hypothetical protein
VVADAASLRWLTLLRMRAFVSAQPRSSLNHNQATTWEGDGADGRSPVIHHERYNITVARLQAKSFRNL